MALARARRERGIDYWPGFVDALSTLILGIVFLLSVFVIVQFFLSQEVTGKDTALQRLNAQLAQLTEMLSLEKVGKANLEDTLASLRANLAMAETERDRLKGVNEGLASGGSRASELAVQLDAQKGVAGRALAQVELLNQQIAALRRQLAAIEGLAGSVREQGQGRAGAHRRSRPAAQPCAGAARAGTRRASARSSSAACARSSATGRTSAWSATASCSSRKCSSMPARRWSGRKGAPSSTSSRARSLELEKQIPGDVAWVLRVDGHTDVRPIASAAYPSNWELSAARAISVVQYLIAQGHLAAAPGRRGLRRIPAARGRAERGRLSPQPPHRAEADGAVSEAATQRSARSAMNKRLKPCSSAFRPGPKRLRKSCSSTSSPSNRSRSAFIVSATTRRSLRRRNVAIVSDEDMATFQPRDESEPSRSTSSYSRHPAHVSA